MQPCINIAYVRVLINISARVPDIVREAVLYVRVNTQAVLVRRIMFGAVALAFVIMLSNIVVAVRDIVREVVCHVETSIRVVTVPHITVGTAVPVPMFIVIPVRVGIQPRVRV